MVTCFYDVQTGLTQKIGYWLQNFEFTYGRSQATSVFVQCVNDGKLKPF